MPKTPTRLLVAALAAVALMAAACGDDSSSTADEPAAADDVSAFEGELVGTFTIDAATCSTDGVSGSYFRMVQPGGTLEAGPYIENFDSQCEDLTYSVLSPGTDGGLVAGLVQPAPAPAFDEGGNGLATAITEPVTFFGVDFATATDPEVDPVMIQSTGGSLTGDLAAFTAYYGGEAFNQGAPKPDGLTPGLTAEPSGTIDTETGAFVLEWTSQIVGGAFNDFTGIWHLEGTFTPAG